MKQLAVFVVLCGGCLISEEDGPSGGGGEGSSAGELRLDRGSYALVGSDTYEAGSDQCGKLDNMRATTFTLAEPIADSVNQYMSLYIDDDFGVDLTGRIIEGEGTIDWQQGYDWWGANIKINDRNVFTMTLAIEYSDSRCRSELVLQLAKL